MSAGGIIRCVTRTGLYSSYFLLRMHYRWTSLLIMAMCLMVTCPEWIGAEGTYIDCMHGNSIPDGVINNYCWIKGTFSVPRHYEKHDRVGWDVSQVGVGPYNPAKDIDDIEVKAYYQWVPFVLFLQVINQQNYK